MTDDYHQLGFSIQPGKRIYAIGDVHGSLLAFEKLMHAIRQDAAERAAAETQIVLLGDLIDRGPDSAQLLAAVARYAKASSRFIVLMGNHEQLMGKALEGDIATLALWLNVGGAQTLASFGVDGRLINEGACAALLAAGQRAVGTETVAWLLALPLHHRSGDVIFVHAGVRRGVPLERQEPKDLLWIREQFLGDTEPRDALVVHGHTIYPEGPLWTDYRVGVDTGAYRTGRLSAIGLEGNLGWTICGG